MMKDEIGQVDALHLAIRNEIGCRNMLRILRDKLRNTTLRYQYTALLEEEGRHVEVLMNHLREVGASETDPLPNPFIEDGSAVQALTVEQLLERIAQAQDRAIDLYEDIASRLSDAHTRDIFRNLSSSEFFHKSKVLTDLQLIRLHTDYY